MKILVCGGRDYENCAAVNRALNSLADVTHVIHGGAEGAGIKVWMPMQEGS